MRGMGDKRGVNACGRVRACFYLSEIRMGIRIVL